MARPAFRAGSAHVRVPATSANLGPGFDSLGLALDLHDDVVAVVGEDGVLVDVAGEGADQVARNEKNLIVTAMRATFDELGGQPRGIELSCANRIPHGRGLGSSAAAIVAGVLLARALVLGGAQALSLADVLGLASRLEGHPDNVAACLLGGLTIAWTAPSGEAAADGDGDGSADESSARAGVVDAVRLDLDPSVTPYLLIPPTSSSTKAARKTLPATVSHGDAAHNAARSALLIAALSGVGRTAVDDDEEIELSDAMATAGVLLAATDDRLHQQYRRTGMTASANLIAALRRAAIPAVLSGAGPSVLAFTRSPAEIQTAADRLPKGWWGGVLAVDRTGAQLVTAQR